MALRNFYKKKLILRNSGVKNTNKLKFLDAGALYYSFRNECPVNNLISCFSMLKLVTLRCPSLLVSKKSASSLKIRKGNPIGVKANFRKKRLESLFFLFIHQILPNLSLFRISPDLKKNNEFVLTFKISDVFVFSDLKLFYFSFNKFQDLRLMLKFNSDLAPNAPKFLLNVFELPNKN